jgi:hypothetical protein
VQHTCATSRSRCVEPRRVDLFCFAINPACLASYRDANKNSCQIQNNIQHSLTCHARSQPTHYRGCPRQISTRIRRPRRWRNIRVHWMSPATRDHMARRPVRHRSGPYPFPRPSTAARSFTTRKTANRKRAKATMRPSNLRSRLGARWRLLTATTTTPQLFYHVPGSQSLRPCARQHRPCCPGAFRLPLKCSTPLTLVIRQRTGRKVLS